MDKDNNEKMKFNLNLLNLAFLGEELYTTSFHYYPMLIIEFMKGYYTTAELYEKNESLMNNNMTGKMKTENSSNSLEDNSKTEDSSNTTMKENKNEETYKRPANSNDNISEQQKDELTNNGNNANTKDSVRTSSGSDFEEIEIKKSKEKNKTNIKPKLRIESSEVKDKKIITQ